MTTKAQRLQDEFYMREALSLALRGTGNVSPNPRVGCVLVRDGIVIGRGWHAVYGEAHAEVNAVRDAGGEVRGATAYITLEPCSHFGKTPPCADMLVEKGITRAVVGVTDPNPKVCGSGCGKLEAAGIEVTAGVLEDECKWFNRGFFRRIQNGRPWVTLKVAASLDGKIALQNGESKWITGPESRRNVHMLRAEHDALLTGVGTVLADDPAFTVRETPGKTPLRVVLDSSLRTPISAKLFETDPSRLLFFADASVSTQKIEIIRGKGAFVETLPNLRDNPARVLEKLAEFGVNYLMVEGGSGIVSSILRAGLADSLSLFIAPKIMGSGKGFADALHFDSMQDLIELKHVTTKQSGSDIWLEGVFSCSPDL